MTNRIALVDDNTYESLLTARALENMGFEVVELVSDWSKFEARMKENQPEALVLSLDSHTVHAIILAERARVLNPNIGLIFITSIPDLRLVGIAENELPHGVQVILKSSITDLQTIKDCIHRSINDSTSRNKVRWVNDRDVIEVSAFASALLTLTAVQIETLRLLALGSSNAEIAKIRVVTEKAVEHTITRILQSLSIASNPSHNARVLLSREYYRWVSVSNKF